MNFSVIIPTYNDWDRLNQCLDALEKQTIGKDRYEIIVVNNSVNQTVPAEIEGLHSVQIIHEYRPGSYIARNKGAEIATGEILAFTDSDCIPDKNWLAYAETIFREKKCDLVGGRVDIFQADIENKYGYIYERLTAFPQYRNVPEGKSVTANLFVKKAVFEAVGGFNSTIKSGGDWEFTLRCTGLGHQMVYGDSVLVLHPARDLYTIFKKQRRLICGGAINVKKKYGYSYLRLLGSHLVYGLIRNRYYLTKPTKSELLIIFSIDFLKYLYRMMIYGGLVFRLIDPKKVRE